MANTTSRQRKGVIDLGGAIAKGFINKRYRDDDRAYQRRVRDEALQREMERMRIQAEANKAIELIRADTSKNEMQKKKEIAEITANAKIEVAQLGRYKKIVNVYDKQGGDGGGYGGGDGNENPEVIQKFNKTYNLWQKKYSDKNQYGVLSKKQIQQKAFRAAKGEHQQDLKLQAPNFYNAVIEFDKIQDTVPEFQTPERLTKYMKSTGNMLKTIDDYIPSLDVSIHAIPILQSALQEKKRFDSMAKGYYKDTDGNIQKGLRPGQIRRKSRRGDITKVPGRKDMGSIELDAIANIIAEGL